VSELGERMTAEEFGWWLAMLDTEWIGPQRQAQLLAHIAAGVRNGPVQGPSGKDSLWNLSDFIDPDRWAPPKPVSSKGLDFAQIKGWFSRFGFK
jgi:hypothetical protein